jgi:hypothetical protein
MRLWEQPCSFSRTVVEPDDRGKRKFVHAFVSISPCNKVASFAPSGFAIAVEPSRALVDRPDLELIEAERTLQQRGLLAGARRNSARYSGTASLDRSMAGKHSPAGSKRPSPKRDVGKALRPRGRRVETKHCRT